MAMRLSANARLRSENFPCITLLLLLFHSYNSATTASAPLPSITTTARGTDSNSNDTVGAEAMSATLSSTYTHAVFSDIDGTLVHYPVQDGSGSASPYGDNVGNENELIYFPPSKTGTRGVLSTRTLQLCHRLRQGKNVENGPVVTIKSNRQQRIDNGGVPFVLVSGMRTSTLFQRLPYLPRADAYVSESGGRIFYPRGIQKDEVRDGAIKGLVIHPVYYSGISSSDMCPFCLVEDTRWKNKISQLHAAGNDGYDDEFTIEQRNGKLWELAQKHTQQGYVLDISGYSTAYRINRKHQPTHLALTFDDFIAECAKKHGIPDGLDCSTNLGCVDIYPAMSGKKNCAEYLVQRFLRHEDLGGEGAREESISLKTHACCLCDDDNDIEMALACRSAYLPSVTSESIRNLVASSRQQQDEGGCKLVVTEDKTKGIVGPLATEAALEAVIRELG